MTMPMRHQHSHLGVYAVILNPSRTHILLIKKARGPYINMLDLPGGSMEEGEMLEQTLQREIMEETNCSVQDFSQLGAFSTLFHYINKQNTPSQLRHIGILYSAQILGTPKTIGDGEDSNGCLWQEIKKIKKSELTPLTLIALQELNLQKKKDSQPISRNNPCR